MPALAISRPHWKTASAVLMAGAVLFAASAANADPRHGGGHDRGGRGHDRGGWGHDRGHHYNRGHSHSSFSLSIGSFYPRPYYYQPVYPATYYAPAPTYYTPPPSYYNNVPINYTQPASMDDSGRYCREYTQQVWVGGRMQQSYGTACLQPDGDWQLDS